MAQDDRGAKSLRMTRRGAHSEEAKSSFPCHSEEAEPTKNLGGGTSATKKQPRRSQKFAEESSDKFNTVPISCLGCQATPVRREEAQPSFTCHPSPRAGGEALRPSLVILSRRRRIWVGDRHIQHCPHLVKIHLENGTAEIAAAQRGEEHGGTRGVEMACQPADCAGFCAWFRRFARFPGQTCDFGHFLG